MDATLQIVIGAVVGYVLGMIPTGAIVGRRFGVDLTRVRSYSDLSPTDIARLGVAIARKDLPFEFTLNVQGLVGRAEYNWSVTRALRHVLAA